jgi:hypothetical protein
MADSTTIAGVSIATIALIISLICLGWILLHIGSQRKLPGSDWYNKYGIFNGGKYY